MSKNLRRISARSRLLFSRPPPPWAPISRSRPFSDEPSPIETLAYEEVQANPDRPYNCTAFVLHGLMGAARNWRTFSRGLAAELHNLHPADDWRFVLVDLRNHGRSARIKNLDLPHNMTNAAKDLANLVKSRGWAWPDVVVAHSMGGKVALDYTQSCARGGYGESAVLPKQNSFGCWILSLGK